MSLSLSMSMSMSMSKTIAMVRSCKSDIIDNKSYHNQVQPRPYVRTLEENIFPPPHPRVCLARAASNTLPLPLLPLPFSFSSSSSSLCSWLMNIAVPCRCQCQWQCQFSLGVVSCRQYTVGASCAAGKHRGGEGGGRRCLPAYIPISPVSLLFSSLLSLSSKSYPIK